MKNKQPDLKKKNGKRNLIRLVHFIYICLMYLCMKCFWSILFNVYLPVMEYDY